VVTAATGTEAVVVTPPVVATVTACEVVVTAAGTVCVSIPFTVRKLLRAGIFHARARNDNSNGHNGTEIGAIAMGFGANTIGAVQALELGSSLVLEPELEPA